MAEAQALAAIAGAGARLYQGSTERTMMRAEADAAERAAAVEAAGLRARANEERAAAAYEANERRRAANKVIGRQVALAADSGGGTGGTILDIIGETAEHGEMQAGAATYKGEQAARGLEDRAAIGTWQAGTKARSMRRRGEAAFTGSIFEGVSKVGEAAYKYGDRQGWWKRDERADVDETDPRTGWRTRVYKARGR